MQWCRSRVLAGVVSAVFLLAGCVARDSRPGGGVAVVTESGGAEQQLLRCTRPVGTAVLLEPENQDYTKSGLSSPVPLVRLMMALSQCVVVVDPAAASPALPPEQARAAGADPENGSKPAAGAIVAADYVITPDILHEHTAAGDLRSAAPAAQVKLTATNVRTGVQDAMAEGRASRADIGSGGFGLSGGVAGVGGAYESTEIGKLTVAAFLDAHNRLVTQLGAIPVGSAGAADNAGYRIAQTVNFRGGPSISAPVLGILSAGTPVRATGVTEGRWWQVEANGMTGWVYSEFIAR